jgi:DNA-binding NarL/FixJ family response regulator
MRILIVERHALLRAGIAALIGTDRPDWELIQVADLVEARLAFGGGCFTVCLIGTGLLRSHDRNELMALRTDYPALKFIVSSEGPHRDAILACFRAGAHGCITAASSVADLLGAISGVVSGAVAVPAAMADVAAPERFGRSPGAGGRETVHLTGRQNDVLSLLGKGRSTKEIARHLDLSVGTIKVHLASIFRALGARNRVEAVIKAAECHYNGVSTRNYG